VVRKLPTEDPAASDVLEAYEAAVGARMPRLIATSLALKHGDGRIPTGCYIRQKARGSGASKAKFLMRVD